MNAQRPWGRFAASFLNRGKAAGFERHLQMLNRGLSRLTDLVDNGGLAFALKVAILKCPLDSDLESGMVA